MPVNFADQVPLPVRHAPSWQWIGRLMRWKRLSGAWLSGTVGAACSLCSRGAVPCWISTSC